MDVRFIFEPLFPQGNPTVKISGEPFVMKLKGDVYPTEAYIKRNNIEIGSTHEATMNALQSGTCVNATFDFTAFSKQ